MEFQESMDEKLETHEDPHMTNVSMSSFENSFPQKLNISHWLMLKNTVNMS